LSIILKATVILRDNFDLGYAKRKENTSVPS